MTSRSRTAALFTMRKSGIRSPRPSRSWLPPRFRATTTAWQCASLFPSCYIACLVMTTVKQDIANILAACGGIWSLRRHDPIQTSNFAIGSYNTALGFEHFDDLCRSTNPDLISCALSTVGRADGANGLFCLSVLSTAVLKAHSLSCCADIAAGRKRIHRRRWPLRHHVRHVRRRQPRQRRDIFAAVPVQPGRIPGHAARYHFSAAVGDVWCRFDGHDGLAGYGVLADPRRVRC